MIKDLIVIITTVLLSIAGVYMVVRFGAAAYYRSKREFMEWLHADHAEFNRRKGD